MKPKNENVVTIYVIINLYGFLSSVEQIKKNSDVVLDSSVLQWQWGCINDRIFILAWTITLGRLFKKSYLKKMS